MGGCSCPYFTPSAQCGNPLWESFSEPFFYIALDLLLHLRWDELANIGDIVLFDGGERWQIGRLVPQVWFGFLEFSVVGEGQELGLCAIEGVEINRGGNAVNPSAAGVLPEGPVGPAAGEGEGGAVFPVVVGDPEGTFGKLFGVGHLVAPEAGRDVDDSLSPSECVQGGEESTYPYLQGDGSESASFFEVQDGWEVEVGGVGGEDCRVVLSLENSRVLGQSVVVGAANEAGFPHGVGVFSVVRVDVADAFGGFDDGEVVAGGFHTGPVDG